jgi:peptidoglycan/xylan/chitin deacetylase (PgdA/CDA1 family)
MIRPLLKTVGAHAMRAARADRLLGSLNGRGQQPLVVCYHRVVEDPSRHSSSAPAMLVGLHTLERQLDWIGRRYRFLSLDDLARGLESGHRFPHPVAAVTFDDGYADVYRHAWPLLRRKGIPFAVFVVSGFVGTRRLHAHDELYVRLLQALARLGPAGLEERLRRLGVPTPSLAVVSEAQLARQLLGLKESLLETLPRHEIRQLIAALADAGSVSEGLREEVRPMSWEMLAQLHEAGVTIGSHTRTHVTLPNESPARVQDELQRSRQTLEQRLGAEIVHLAYPGGRFCRLSVEAAAEAGYRYAYTTCSHRFADRRLLTIPRRTFWERSAAGLVGSFSPAVASCQVQGIFDPLHSCPGDHDDDAGAFPARRIAS